MGEQRPPIDETPRYPPGTPHGADQMAPGRRIGAHNDVDGQLMYATLGLAGQRRPARRIPAKLCGELATDPGMFSVNPLLREALLSLTSRQHDQSDHYRRLRTADEDRSGRPGRPPHGRS